MGQMDPGTQFYHCPLQKTISVYHCHVGVLQFLLGNGSGATEGHKASLIYPHNVRKKTISRTNQSRRKGVNDESLYQPDTPLPSHTLSIRNLVME